jgi:hypothetical protein
MPLGAIMYIIIFFVISILLNIPVTAVLCHVRAARKKRLSGGTVLAGASISALLFVLGEMYFDSGGKEFMSDLFARVLIMTIVSILPAVAVVHYYQKRSKRDGTNVA